jgi:hypothetical protein
VQAARGPPAERPGPNLDHSKLRPRSGKDQKALTTKLDGLAARHGQQFTQCTEHSLGVVNQFDTIDCLVERPAIPVSKLI